MKKASRRSRSYPTAVMMLFTGFLMHGQTYYVTVDDAGFSPSSLSIQAGDTVQWENVDDLDFPHTTTSTLDLLDPDYWDYELVGTGEIFAKTFNNPGTFQYYDRVDGGVGLITVTPPSVTPVINLESPQLEGGQFLFDVTGLTLGKTNVLWASPDLTTWLPSSTNVTSGATVTFTNMVVPGKSFYRVMEVE